MDILNQGQANNPNRGIPQISIPLDSIVVQGRLGSGVFGTVFKGIVAGTSVALKVVKDPSERELNRIKREAETMSKLSHPRLARFMGTTSVPLNGTVGGSAQCLAIVSELCDTDLSKACREERENNPHFQTKAVGWLCEAAEGIAWLHTMCHMLHRDIKPANILLKDGHAVVTDFGFTQVLDTADETLREGKVRGTGYYIAPEILRHQPFSYPADVYAFGMTMCEIISGRVSAHKIYSNASEFFRDVCNGVRPDVSDLPEKGVKSSLIELIQACWDDDPRRRPSMLQVGNRLKEIFVETVVPQTNPAYGFWLQHFGDKLADEVCVSELLNHLPNKENKDVVDAYMWILKGRLNPHTVTLRHLANTCEWYGDWLHNGTAVSIKTSLSEHKWFLGFASREAAQQCGMDYLSEHQEPCFTVRCSETNPSRTPFTIDVFKQGTIRRYRIQKQEYQFCPILCLADFHISGKDIIDLANLLDGCEMIGGARKYDGTVSKLRTDSVY